MFECKSNYNVSKLSIWDDFLDDGIKSVSLIESVKTCYINVLKKKWL